MAQDQESTIQNFAVLQSRFISYNELAATNLKSETGAEGIKIISVDPLKVGSFTFKVINAAENQSYDLFKGQKYSYLIEVEEHKLKG